MSRRRKTVPTPKFAVGDKVYRVHLEQVRKSKPCPDCLDTGKWTVTTPAGQSWEVNCNTCAYHRNAGLWEYEARVEMFTVGSVRIDTAAQPLEVVSYMCEETGVGSGSIYYEAQFYATQQEAEAQFEAEIAARVAECSESMLRESKYAKEAFYIGGPK